MRLLCLGPVLISWNWTWPYIICPRDICYSPSESNSGWSSDIVWLPPVYMHTQGSSSGPCNHHCNIWKHLSGTERAEDGSQGLTRITKSDWRCNGIIFHVQQKPWMQLDYQASVTQRTREAIPRIKWTAGGFTSQSLERYCMCVSWISPEEHRGLSVPDVQIGVVKHGS